MYIYIEQFLFLTRFYVDSQRVLRVDHLFYKDTYTYIINLKCINFILLTRIGFKLQNVDVYYGQY